MGNERVLWVLSLGIAVACAGAPKQSYAGPELPRSEIAVLRETSNAIVMAIDNGRVSGTSWALLPGRHELLLQVRIYTQSLNMNYTVWSYCRVTLIAVAGEGYVSRVRTRKEAAPGISDRVKMEVGIADSEGLLRAVPSSCSPERPDLES